MNFKELQESAGGMAKRWLEAQTSPHYWTDSAGNRYTMSTLVQFPIKTKELPMEDLVLEIETVIENIGKKLEDINLVNKQPIAPSAAMLVVMQDQKKKLWPFLKFFRKRTLDNVGMHWTPTDFEKETGLAWEQTRVVGTGKDRQEEVIKRIGLKPVDVIETNTDIRIMQVPVQVDAKLKERSVDKKLSTAIGQLVNNALLGKTTTVKGLVPYERDIKVDFGEVATPLALVSGNLAGGNYQEVEAQLLKTLGVSWKSARSVFYPAALNEPLYDSQLNWSNGTTLRISNKAEGKGGAASLSSIAGVIKKYPERFSAKDNQLLKTKYKMFVTAIDEIMKYNAVDGPLVLATAMGIITTKEVEIVRLYVNQKITSGTKNITPNLKNIMKLMAAKTDRPDYAICYHLISAIARACIQRLNADVNLTTEFFTFILSRANLIQVNQFTIREGDAVGWSKFDVIWPPIFTGKIVFSAADYQANKRPGARLAFKT